VNGEWQSRERLGLSLTLKRLFLKPSKVGVEITPALGGNLNEFAYLNNRCNGELRVFTHNRF